MTMLKRWLLMGVIVMVTTGWLPRSHAQTKLQVVVSFSILGDVVSQVAGDAAEVTTLMPVNTDPHTFTPTPRDVAALVEADVVFINGAAFEESLADIFTANADDINLVEVSTCVPIWSIGEAEDKHTEGETHTVNDTLAARCAANMEELGNLTGIPEYFGATLGQLYTLECLPHQHEGAAYEAGGCDPHVWMDPHNGLLWTMFIRDTLSELDPAHADTYAANASAYMQQLSAVIDSNAALLNAIPQDKRVLITSHNTFGYLVNPFDFQVVEGVIPGSGTAGEPSASEFVDLIKTIQETGVPAIFAENTLTPALVERLADETGVTIELLYTDSLGDTDSPAPTYIDLLTYNATTIAAALGGE